MGFATNAEVEPYCNHDAVAVVNGVCECGEKVGRTDLERLADAYAADINKLEAGEWPAEYEADNYANEDAVSTWLEAQLEVYGDYRRSFGHDEAPVLRSVGVLMAYGGPSARFETDDEGHGTVRVYSWGDEETRNVYAPILADRLFEMLEDYE